MTEGHRDDRLNSVLRALGERVRAMRLARGMSLTALSFEAELSEQRIRSIEAGRTAVPLATLVALADVLEVGVSDLFGDGVSPTGTTGGIDAPSSSPHVVPSPVIWGGELPPAPWLAPRTEKTEPIAASRVAESPPVAAPVTSSPAGAPAEIAAAGPVPVVGLSPQIAPGTEVLPPAPWQTVAVAAARSAAPAPAGPVADGPALHTPSVAPRVHQRAAERGMKEASAYVFVAPGAGAVTAPRTFADLRVGPLAGRNFRSLQDFAVASVVEGNHAIADVARVFRVPAWRLEQWVRESGHAV